MMRKAIGKPILEAGHTGPEWVMIMKFVRDI